MNNSTKTHLQAKLSKNWELIKDRYPIVVNPDAILDDAVQHDVLAYFDGLKSSEEIRVYLTLNESESNMIFTDLIRAGAIRFLEDVERPKYLKQQNIELKRNYDFLFSEKNRLAGENLYLEGQVKEKEAILREGESKIPENQKILADFNQKTEQLKGAPDHLFQDNADLLYIKNEMADKEEKVSEVLVELEDGLPRLIRRKLKLGEMIERAGDNVDQREQESKDNRRRLSSYRDTIDELRNDLLDTKSRIRELIEES